MDKATEKIFHWRGRNVFPNERLRLHVNVNWADATPNPEHDHDFMELVMVVRGKGYHHTTGETAGELRRGDVLVLRPGVSHNYRDCQKLIYYNCMFGVELLQKELAWIRQIPELDYLFWSGPKSLEGGGVLRLHLPEKTTKMCERILKDLQKKLTQDNHPNHLLIISDLTSFLGWLMEEMGPVHRAASQPSRALHASVQRAIELLEQDVAHPWTLSVLARQLCIHPRYLTRLFKSQLGLPPIAYLARVRGNLAARLLLKSDLPVSEIAIQAGWPEPAKFSHRFRQQFGCSPSIYRNSFRKREGHK